MKRASEVLGLKVLGIREGMENGSAQDFMIDPQTRKVEYLVLKTNNGYGFNALRISDVMGIGADYIMTQTVENAKKMYESTEVLEVIERGFFMLGTTVLASTGDMVGKVEDFSFEEKTEFEGSKIVTMAGKMVFVDPEGTNILKVTQEAEPQGEAFQSESFQYLMGKTVKETVTSEDGSFRIEADTVLGEEILRQAARHDDVLLALTLNV